MQEIKGMKVDVFISKKICDHSHNGISNNFDTIFLTGPGVPEIEDHDGEIPVVIMDEKMGVKRALVEKQKGRNGPTMGGAFIYSCDSRFPSDGPIRLLDRIEE